MRIDHKTIIIIIISLLCLVLSVIAAPKSNVILHISEVLFNQQSLSSKRNIFLPSFHFISIYFCGFHNAFVGCESSEMKWSIKMVRAIHKDDGAFNKMRVSHNQIDSLRNSDDCYCFISFFLFHFIFFLFFLLLLC